jgi:hypothetical protein
MSGELLATWLCSCTAIFILSFRLLVQRYLGFNYNGGDYLCLLGILLLVAYVSMSHIIIIWGNNNIPPASRTSYHFSPQEIRHREVGSKITLVLRVLYISLYVPTSWADFPLRL